MQSSLVLKETPMAIRTNHLVIATLLLFPISAVAQDTPPPPATKTTTTTTTKVETKTQQKTKETSDTSKAVGTDLRSLSATERVTSVRAVTQTKKASSGTSRTGGVVRCGKTLKEHYPNTTIWTLSNNLATVLYDTQGGKLTGAAWKQIGYEAGHLSDVLFVKTNVQCAARAAARNARAHVAEMQNAANRADGPAARGHAALALESVYQLINWSAPPEKAAALQ